MCRSARLDDSCIEPGMDSVFASYTHGLPMNHIPLFYIPPYLQPTNFEARFTCLTFLITSHQTSLRIHGCRPFCCKSLCSCCRLHRSRSSWLLWPGLGNSSRLAYVAQSRVDRPFFRWCLVLARCMLCVDREMTLSSVCCIRYDGEAQAPSSPASRGCIPLPLIQSNQDCAAGIELGRYRDNVFR